MTRKDDDLEAMITATTTTTTVTPGKGLKIDLPDYSPSARLYAEPFWTKVVNNLADMGFGFLAAIEWAIQHAVSIAITWAMIAFGTYWAVATAYLIGANR